MCKKIKIKKILALILKNYCRLVSPHCAVLDSEAWPPCCSLLSMMLMKSCSFMCSISCSLLVDSKLHTGQQKSSTQYSRPADGTPVPPFLTDNPSALCGEEDDVFSFWLRMMYGRSEDKSWLDFEGTAGDLMQRN